MKETQQGKGNRVFWLSLFFCTVYLSYRYPLQINSSGTSPTYSDTPVALQAGKFLLAVPLFVIAASRCLRNACPQRQWLVTLGVLFLSSYSLVKILGDNNSKYLEASFWMLFAFLLAWGTDAVRISAIDRYLRYLLIYALGSTLIEVVLFVVFGRLPALAFGETFLIRFGGFLDDPNGFGAILFLLMGWSYGRFKGRTRFFIVGSIVISLLLTQSWTAIGFFTAIFLLWVLTGVSKRPVSVLLAIGAFSWLILFLAQKVPPSTVRSFVDMLETKQGSIEGHSMSWGPLISNWDSWVLLGGATYDPYESWWAGAPINFGVPWILVFLGLIAKLIMSLGSGLSRAGGEARPIYLGFFLFGSYFVIGSLNLPFPTIFPINFLFFLFSFLVALGKIRHEDGTSVQPLEAEAH
jgi:hypothetical protein